MHLRPLFPGPVGPLAPPERGNGPLRRATRKGVYEAAGSTEVAPSDLVTAARRLHRSADRAGLLACGDIGAAFSTLERGQPSIESIRASARCLDLLRFWTHRDSPLWRNDA